MDRITWELEPAPGIRLEVALDAGRVESGGRHEEISEVEIECVDAPPAAELVIYADPARGTFRYASVGARAD